MNMLSRYLIIGIVMGAMGCNAAGMDKDKMDTSLATRKRSSPSTTPRPGGSPADPYLWGSMSRSSSSEELFARRSSLSSASLSSASSQTSSSTSSAEPSPSTPTRPSIPWEPSTKKLKIDREQEEKKKKEAHEESTSNSDALHLDTPDSTPEPKVPLTLSVSSTDVPLALPPSSDMTATVPIVARLKLPSPVGPTGDSPTTVALVRLQNFNLDGDKHDSDSFAVPAPRLPLSAQAVIKMEQEEKKKKLSAEREGSDEATELMEAVFSSNVEDVKKLLSASKADINKKDAQGDTALHWAISQGMKDDAALLEIIKLLLQNNADINMTGYSGQNAIETAKTHLGSGPIVDLLVAHASKLTTSSSG